MSTTIEIPEEERGRGGRTESYEHLVRRLSHQSVVKHFDAYADISWDDPDFQVSPDDPRWELSSEDPLGGTAWYQAQPATLRSRIGLHTIATFAKIGGQFENVLQRGLLEYAQNLPNGAVEFRYVYHEVIEEGHHTLMFQEFVNRTGLEIPGLGWWEKTMSRRVVAHARRFPSLFFIFVLGGEDPIDHVQRTVLRSGRPIHPLMKRMMQIHVTEEARHLCFARQYLRRRVPQLNVAARTALAIGAPIILGQMSRLMMQVSPHIVRTYGIPSEVLREAYDRNAAHQQAKLDALKKVRDLCSELGLVTPWSRPLWQGFGIWEPNASPA
jgi:P-aminobenzoate N-oxygenase AurF